MLFALLQCKVIESIDIFALYTTVSSLPVRFHVLYILVKYLLPTKNESAVIYFSTFFPNFAHFAFNCVMLWFKAVFVA